MATLVITASSLTFSLSYYNFYFTFFLLPARIWELCIGALLFLVKIDSFQSNPQISLEKHSTLLGVTGLVLVFFSAVMYDDETPKKNAMWAIPPVLGSFFVLLVPPSSLVAHVLSRPWLVYLGDASYSIYLWHWPFIVTGALFIQNAEPPLNVNHVLVSVIAAAISLIWSLFIYHFFETPIRRLVFNPVTNLLLGACGITTTVWLARTRAHASLLTLTSYEGNIYSKAIDRNATLLWNYTNSSVDTSYANNNYINTHQIKDFRGHLANGTSNLTSHHILNSVLDLHTIMQDTLSVLPSDLTPSLKEVYDFSNRGRWNDFVHSATNIPPEQFGLVYSANGTNARFKYDTIILFGDSHAHAIAPAIIQIAHNWDVNFYIYYKPNCYIVRYALGVEDQKSYDVCTTFISDFQAHLLKAPRTKTLLVVNGRVSNYVANSGGVEKFSATAEEMYYSKTLGAWKSSTGIDIVLLQDNPIWTILNLDPYECLQKYITDISKCAKNIKEIDAGVPQSPIFDVEESIAKRLGIRYVRTWPFYCVNDRCPVVVSKYLVTADGSHITGAYAKFLAPYFEKTFAPEN